MGKKEEQGKLAKERSLVLQLESDLQHRDAEELQEGPEGGGNNKALESSP